MQHAGESDATIEAVSGLLQDCDEPLQALRERLALLATTRQRTLFEELQAEIVAAATRVRSDEAGVALLAQLDRCTQQCEALAAPLAGYRLA